VESELDRINRRTVPDSWPRFAIWLVLTFAASYLHTRIRPFIFARLPGEFLRDVYIRSSSALFLISTLASAGGLVACYYYALRERRIHTALTEFGLAVRSVIAGLLLLVAFVLALMINDLM
jgi:hypothetical protein